MTYDEMREIVLDLPFDTMTEIYNNGAQAMRPFQVLCKLKKPI